MIHKSNGRIRSFIAGAALVVVVMTYYNAWYGECREECKQEIVLAHYQEVFNELDVAQEVTRVTRNWDTPPVPPVKPKQVTRIAQP